MDTFTNFVLCIILAYFLCMWFLRVLEATMSIQAHAALNDWVHRPDPAAPMLSAMQEEAREITRKAAEKKEEK